MAPIYWSIFLLIAALITMALELFVPSGGVLGFLSVASCIASIVAAFQGGPAVGVTMLLVIAVLLPVVLALALKIWPRTPFGRLVMQAKPTQEEVLPQRRDLAALVGRRGVARTKMLPSGMVTVGGETFDAMSRGEALDAGDEVEVVGVNTKWLVVRRAAGRTAAEPLEQQQADLLGESLENLELPPLDE